MIETLLFPFKIWKACRFVPLLLLLVQVAAVWVISSFLTPFLYAELERGVAAGRIPDWAIGKLQLTILILPWFAYFPCLYSLSGYPARLTFLKFEGGITIRENFFMWWRALEKSFQCYAFMWRPLLWRLLPVIAILLTRSLMPAFISPQYRSFSDNSLEILALIAFFSTFSILLSPLTAAIGLYDPFTSWQFSRAAFQTQKWKVLLFSLVFYGLFYLVLQDSALTSRHVMWLPAIGIVLLYLFLSFVGVSYVRAIAQIEADGRR